MMTGVGSPLLWVGFVGFVLAMLALDLGVFHRKQHAVGFREALTWSIVWVGLALVFNLGVYFWFGPERGLEFLTGYVIEKALSVDNLFVFLVIFSYFSIKPALQHRVLFWGILGALVLRAVFIFAGGALLARFHWAIYVFGGILVVTGLKLFMQRAEETHPERNPLIRLIARTLPFTKENHGAHFTVVQAGRRLGTPLLLALITVELTDVIFAVDSIPAVLAVTTDPFIVFSSNVFAILGLRSLYFLLAGTMDRFRYLRVGLAGILVFVGAKMMVAPIFKVPITASLAVIATILTASIVFSLLRTRPAVQPAVVPAAEED